MFERRAGKGQCINQPYLGCREFPAFFSLVGAETKEPAPVALNGDFGFMLYDLDFTNLNDPQPMFFRARLADGVMEVPVRDSDEVRR